jgi:hypothetical protein
MSLQEESTATLDRPHFKEKKTTRGSKRVEVSESVLIPDPAPMPEKMPDSTHRLIRKNKDISVNQVFVTNDYLKFKFLEGNRGVDPAHVKELVNSMGEKYLEMPIHVNGRFEVIDGQHRVEACQELQLPVYYIMHDDWGLNEVHVLNTHQVNWNSLDYLHSHAKRGNEHYQTFEKFMEDYGFGYQVSYALLTNTTSAPRGHKTKEFRRGKFEVADLQRAIKIADVIKQFAPFYAGYNTALNFKFRDNFCLAIIRIANKNIEYIEELLAKFTSGVAPVLYHRPLVSDYIKELEELFNHGKHANSRVRWI